MTDPAELRAGLSSVLEAPLGAPVDISDLMRLSGGASRETWMFKASTGQTAQMIVLKRDPPHLVSDPEMEAVHISLNRMQEAQLLRAAKKADVPVPDVIWSGDETSPIGAGFMMRHVPGIALGHKIIRDADLAKARANLTGQCAAALAKIHKIPLDAALPDIPELSPRTYLDYQAAQLAHYGFVEPGFEYGIACLRERVPSLPTRRSFVHGDFRNGNMLVGPDGLNAVLDWEICHIGDPIHDLGWITIRSWRFGGGKPVGGFGEREELIEAYQAAGGAPLTLEDLRFWEVFGCLRWGIICLNMAYGHLSGSYRSVERAVIGRRAAEAEYDLLNLVD